MLTAMSMGVGERPHVLALEGLRVQRNTNAQKVLNGQDGGLVLVTSASDALCLINDMWMGMTQDMTIYPVFR